MAKHTRRSKSSEDSPAQGPGDIGLEQYYGHLNQFKPVKNVSILPGFTYRRGRRVFLHVSWNCLKVRFNKVHEVRNANDRLIFWTRVAVQTFPTEPQSASVLFLRSQDHRRRRGIIA